MPCLSGLRLLALRGLAAAFLVFFAVLFALPLQAQAQTTLVSNIGTSSDAVSSPIGSNWDHAQGFTTGANTSGYTLTSIEVKLIVVGGGASGTTPSATLHKTNARDASVATLTGPTTTTGGNVTFTAPANTTLDANSTYFILLQGGTNVHVERTNSDSEDTGGVSDWSVLDAGHYRTFSATGSLLSVAEAKQIRVNGTVGGTPPTLSTDATLSVLDLEENDGTTITLSPTFASGTTTYTAMVANAVDEITIIPTVNESNATYEIQDGDGTPLVDATGTTGFQVALSEGENEINVEVTAQDATTTETYEVTVTRSRRVTTTPPAPPEAMVPNDWSLIPAGLGAGDKFRLLFLSSTETDGTSYDIADYNTFIQGRAAAGHTDIQTYSSGFRAVGCTADSDATVNTGTTGTGEVIHWLGGNKVADDYVDFYDGSWDEEANDKDEDGNNGPDTSVSGSFPLTGCAHDGTEFFLSTQSEGLGASIVRLGRPNSSASSDGPLSSSSNTRNIANRPIYGLSQVFEVAASTNSAPTFNDGTSTSRIFNESIGDATADAVTRTDIGQPVTATDTDTGDTLEYDLEGTDAAKFTINTTNGQIMDKGGENYDREAKASYSVTVTVVDGNGGSDTITVALNVVDQNEPPLKPGVPSVVTVSGDDTRLAVSWSARDNTGRPNIDSYDLRYKKTTESGWTNGPQNVTGGGVQILGLVPGTEYQIQIRATNNEGDSSWSNSRTASTSGVLPVTVSFEQAAYSATEGGSVVVKVILSADPERSFTIPIEPANQGGATNSDYSIDATAVAFNSGDMEVTFVFSATQDSIDDDGESVDISFGTLPAGVTAGSPAVTTVSITDNDTAGVTVSPTTLTVTEDDTAGGTYTVVLDSQPTANVTIGISGQSGTDVTTASTPMTFTTVNWETAQTVTVTAGGDADLVDDLVTLTHAATSSDTDYSGITIDSVAVTVEDNDTAQVTGLMVEPGNAQLVVQWTEVDNATGYQVQWKSGGQSYNNSGRQATIGSGSTTSHTITSLTNDTEYTVRVRATRTRTGANDGPYSDEVMETPVEPTAPGVTVSTMALTVTEEDVAGDTYTVVLDTEPTASVVVTVTGHAGTDVNLTPSSGALTFTTGNWETAQDVTVKAGNDVDTTNDTVTLTHAATGSDTDYSGITIADVVVTVEDNDTAQVTGVMIEPGNAQLVVQWMAVDNATGYEVQWKSGGTELQQQRAAGHDHLGYDHKPHDHEPHQRDHLHGAGESDADGGQRGSVFGGGDGDAS